MSVMWTGLKLDLKQIKANYIKLVLFAVSMIVLCLAIGVAGSKMLYDEKTVEPFGLAIVDLEDSQWTHLIIDAVKQMETVTKLCDIQVMSEVDAADKLKSGEVAAVITIPDHFVYDAMVGTNTPLIVEKEESTMIEGIVVDKLITAATKLLSAAQAGIYASLDSYNLHGDQNAEHYNLLLQEINLVFAKKMLARNSMFLEKEVVATGSLSPLGHYLISGFIVMMMLSLIFVMNIIQPINKQEMVMRFKVAGIKGRYIVGQKFIALTLFNLIFGLLGLTAIAFGMSKIDEHIVWKIDGISIASGILCAAGLAALGLFIGMLLNGKEAYSLFVFMIALIQAFFSGGLVPEAFLPDAINKLGYFTYNKYAIALLGHGLGLGVEMKYYLGMIVMIIGALVGCCALLRKRGIKI